MADLIACSACGVVHEQASALVADLREQIEGLRAELASQVLAKRRLRSDQAKAIELHPRYDDAIEVLETWRTLCAPRTKELNGPRLKNVISRLEHGYSVEDLQNAASGYAAFPFVTDGKRCATGQSKYVDAELIYRDARHVDAGIVMSEKAKAQATVTQISAAVRGRVLSWRDVKIDNRRLIIEFLSLRFGTKGLDHANAWIEFPCPGCSDVFDEVWPLRVNPVSGATQLVDCWRCNISDDRVLDMADSFLRGEAA